MKTNTNAAVAYLTYQVTDQGINPRFLYEAEEAAAAAVGRSKDAYAKVSRMLDAAGINRAYGLQCSQQREDTSYPASDGYWYSTEEAAAAASSVYAVRQSTEFKAAYEQWTNEDGFMAVAYRQ